MRHFGVILLTVSHLEIPPAKYFTMFMSALETQSFHVNLHHFKEMTTRLDIRKL